MILTLIPIRPFYQTLSVGDGRLRMRRPASLSAVSLQAIYGTRYTEARVGWGSVGDGRLRMRPPAGYDHIRKVTLSQKQNKMSETARTVGRERTTSILAYIGFRPLWSSNVELILRWDVCVVIMKDIIYKCYRYRAESDTLRFTAYVMIKWRHLGDQAGRTRRFKTWIIIRSHGIKKDQIMSLE